MKVVVLGTGITKFGEMWEKSLPDLAQDAANLALADSKIDPGHIDAVFVANMLYSRLGEQNQLGALIASSLGASCPAYSVEAACASGGIAINLAYTAILSGQFKNILVVGAEKMTDQTTAQIGSGLMGAASEEERTAGLTFPGLYALMTSAHMQKFKTTKRQLAKVAVKNHFNGSLNPNAQYQRPITMEKVLASPLVASPLTLLDCSPISDGAAAVILSATDANDKVTITASTVASDHLGIAQRKSLTEIPATKIAAQKAYRMANLTPKDINLAEVHDCFTIAEILAIEDLGFCAKGQGGKFTDSGATQLNGKLPINTSGGLKACGHPVGATGIKQVIEINDQLLKKAGKRQIKGAKVGLTHNVGGSGATVAVHILQI